MRVGTKDKTLFVISKMKSSYFDFNLFNQLHVAIDNVKIKNSISIDQKNDYESLIKIWSYFDRSLIEIITCKDDSLMEFANYNNAIRSYSEIEAYLSSNHKMLRRFELYKKVTKGKLLIHPFGEYGYGSGPFGGGPKENYKLLEKLRVMLNRNSPQNSQKDRDARHIMHSILYGCNYFVTMDYKIVANFSERLSLIQDFLDENNFTINIVTPSKLLNNLKI